MLEEKKALDFGCSFITSNKASGLAKADEREEEDGIRLMAGECMDSGVRGVVVMGGCWSASLLVLAGFCDVGVTGYTAQETYMNK